MTKQSGSLIVTPPTFAYTRPCSRPAASRTIRISAGIVKKQARTTEKWQIMEINVMFQAVQGMWSAGMGWCLYSERHGNQITRSNKIMGTTKGTWLAASGSLLQYIRFHLPRVRRDDWGWWRMIYRSWTPLTSIWSCKMCGKYCCSIVWIEFVRLRISKVKVWK